VRIYPPFLNKPLRCLGLVKAVCVASSQDNQYDLPVCGEQRIQTSKDFSMPLVTHVYLFFVNSPPTSMTRLVRMNQRRGGFYWEKLNHFSSQIARIFVSILPPHRFRFFPRQDIISFFLDPFNLASLHHAHVGFLKASL